MVLECCDNNELCINHNNFLHKETIDGLFIPKIKVTPMKSAQYVEFLGVIFDAKMSGILNLNGKAVEKTWDLGPITLHASFIWNHISDPKQRLKKFQRLAYPRDTQRNA